MPRIENPASSIPALLEGVHLFHFDGAPCAQRVRFALAEKGLRRGREVRFDDVDAAACAGEQGAWVSRVVSLVKKEHLSAAYAGIQPNLVVPALVHDGALYTESMDIVAYLDSAFGGEPLVPRQHPAQLQEAEQLTELGKQLHRSIRFVTFRWGLGRLGRLNAKEEAELKTLLQANNGQDAGADGEQLISFYESYDKGSIPDTVYLQHLQGLGDAFQMLEQRLADGRSFLTGDTLTMADVIWAMKMLRLTECGYPFADLFPRLYGWFTAVRSRPAFQSGVMGHHRVMHRAFRVKARIENVLGIGLRRVVHGQAQGYGVTS